MRQQVVTLMVVVVVGLAGCAGGLSGGDGGPDVAEQTWTDGESVAVDELLASHRSAVAAADAVTATSNRSLAAGEWMQTTVRVDRTAERLYVNTSIVGGQTEGGATAYVANGTQYGKIGPTSQPEYSAEPLRESFETATDDALVSLQNASVVAQWNWTYAGYDDGAFRFEADGLDPNPDAPQSVFNVPMAADGSGTLVVSEGGVVRELSLETVVPRDTADGQNRTAAVTTTYGALNGTTVSEPSWLDEAA